MSVSPLWPRDVTIGEIRGRDMSQWCTTISSTRQNLASGKSSAFWSFHFEWLYDPLLWLYIWLLIIEGVDHDDLPLASPADRPPTNQTEGGQKVWSVTIPIQVVSHHRRLPYLSSTIHCVHYCLLQIFTLFFWITSPGSCDDLESFNWREVRYLSYFLDNGNSENYMKLKGPPSKSHIHQCQQYKHFAQDTIEGALVLPITDNVSPLHQTLVQLIESGKVVSYIKYMCVTTPDFATNYNYSHASDTLWHNTVTKFSGSVWQTYFLTIVA